MPENWYDVKVRCCYYHWSEKRKRLVCEGVFPGAVSISAFDKVHRFEDVMESYCMGDYESCPIHRMLDEKNGEHHE